MMMMFCVLVYIPTYLGAHVATGGMLDLSLCGTWLSVPHSPPHAGRRQKVAMGQALLPSSGAAF